MTKIEVNFAEHLSVEAISPPIGTGMSYFVITVFAVILITILLSAFAKNDGEIESK